MNQSFAKIALIELFSYSHPLCSPIVASTIPIADRRSTRPVIGSRISSLSNGLPTSPARVTAKAVLLGGGGAVGAAIAGISFGNAFG